MDSQDRYEQTAAVMTFSSAETNRALRDMAAETMDDGHAKSFLNDIRQFASGDYDPRDVIVLVIRPAGMSNAKQ